MIRLSALQTIGGEIRGWCRSTLPLLVCFRLCISQEPQYLALFWIGWKVLASNYSSDGGSSSSDGYLSGFQNKNQRKSESEMNDRESLVDGQDSTGTMTNNAKRFKSTQQKYLHQPQHCLLFPRTTTAVGDNLNENGDLVVTPQKDQQGNGSSRDDNPFLVFPTDVWVQHICSFLHPRDVTTLARVNTAARAWADHPDVWKHLWLRDYGKALLQWQISRHVMEGSLMIHARATSSGSTDSTDTKQATTAKIAATENVSLEGRLSDWLDRHAQVHANTATIIARSATTTATTCTTKRFYFVFGEIYENYLLARYNTNTNTDNECFVGLHGHIFDFGAFSQYHPGLVEPILLECGRDATNYFEDVQHSRVARDLARRLCVLANPSCVGEEASSDNDNTQLQSSYGLIVCHPQSGKELTRVLKRSNTRPQPLKRPNYLLPDKTSTRRRRPPTLLSIRDEWDEVEGVEERRVQEEEQLRFLKNPLAAWRNRTSPPVWRIYYDPFLQVWKKWDAQPTETGR
jgi:hypothetical protein